MAKKHGKGRGGLPKGISYADILGAKRKAVQDALENAKSDYARALCDRQAQREQWLSIVALSEAFGFGADRVAKFLDAVKDAREQYARHLRGGDQEYADEKLRRSVEEIAKQPQALIYENLMPESLQDPSEFAITREDITRIRGMEEESE